MSPDEVAPPEELPPAPSGSSIPPAEEESLQGVAQALASAYRPVPQQRVSVLLDEAQGFLPADDRL